MNLLLDLVQGAEEAARTDIADRLDQAGFIWVSDFVRALPAERGALARVVKNAVASHKQVIADQDRLIDSLMKGSFCLAEQAEKYFKQVEELRSIVNEFTKPPIKLDEFAKTMNRARKFLEEN